MKVYDLVTYKGELAEIRQIYNENGFGQNATISYQHIFGHEEVNLKDCKPYEKEKKDDKK